MQDYEFEPLQQGLEICVSDEHKFGTDAFLLADFSRARHKDKVCDLGTGCGIIPLILKLKYAPAEVYGVDIQKQAIEQFRVTVEHNKLDGIFPIEADLKTLWDGCPKGTFDLVVCNPPYKVRGAGFESEGEAHRIARHEILCDINDVCRAAAKLLKYGGRLCLCNRPERLADVICAMRGAGIEPKLIRFVCKTPSDPSWLFLVEGKLGGKPFMRTLPSLYVRENGLPSKEMLEIYGGDKEQKK